MKLPPAEILCIWPRGAAALPTISGIARAQVYPTRPVRIIVGFAAGSGYDMIGHWLSDRLGQPFVIENQPGAATNVATQSVVNAPPDGYTVLLAGPTNTINTTFYRKLNFDFIRGIAPRGDYHSVGSSHPDQSIVSSQNNSWAHRLREGQSRQDQHVFARGWVHKSPCHRAVQDAGWRQLGPVPFGGNAPELTALIGGQVDLISRTTSRGYPRASPAG
jgi:tripartite-type tricarboxylate transporter receptor subunit TctC